MKDLRIFRQGIFPSDLEKHKVSATWNGDASARSCVSEESGRMMKIQTKLELLKSMGILSIGMV